MTERIVLSVEEVAEMLGCSRPTAYRYVASGSVPSIRLNGHIYVPKAPFLRLFDDEESGSQV